MSVPLILACIWALVATATAFMPLRWQAIPGVVLLAAAPVLLVWIGLVHGTWIAALCLAAFASMFRNPLRYLWARSRGKEPDLPPKIRAQTTRRAGR